MVKYSKRRSSKGGEATAVSNGKMVKKEIIKEDKSLHDNSSNELLVEKKYEYDLLTNELFHLKEYISLIDYDPTYTNDYSSNVSFNKFLKDEKLILNDESINPEKKIDESLSNGNNGNNKIRRRQLRASTTINDNSSNVNNDFNNNSIEYHLEKVKPLVQNKFNLLKSQLEDNDIDEKKNINYDDTKRHNNNNNNKVKKEKRNLKYQVIDKSPVKFNNNVNHNKENINVPTLTKAVNNTKRKSSKISKETTLKEEEIYDDIEHVEIPKGSYIYDDDKNDYYYYSSSSEDELPKKKSKRNTKYQNFHLYVNPPKQTVTNPENIAKPSFNNLQEFLDSFKLFDEEMTIEDYNEFIKEQRLSAKAIRKGLKSNILRYDPDSNSIQPLTTKDASLSQLNKPNPVSYFYKEQNLNTYQEFFINQGVHLSKLFRSSTRARVARAKRVSQMIEQHFKHIANADQRRLKEEEKQRRAINRAITQAVKKRWTVAEKAYKVLKRDEEDKLKTIQGKKHLSKILEQSTQLLGAQLNQVDDSGDDEHEEDILSTSDEDDENLSSSSIEDENEVTNKQVKNINDAQLSTDELKEKYKSLDDKIGLTLSESSLNSDDSSVLTGESEQSMSESEVSANEVTDNDEDRGSIGLSSLIGKGLDDEDIDDSEDFVMEELDEEEDETVEIDDTETVSSENNNASDDDSLLPTDQQLSVVDVPVPSLLRGTLRVYQKQGLNWLASLYNNQTNGILADEMGLGKTIQTISLLAYLACEKQNWGPHLIIVPTSVLLNWEMEFKRFAPGFKVLTYYGSPQQRKEKRKGWNKPDAFHVCIVSYQLVVQDQHSFKRKKWQYMVLDEAHNIKNFRSARWQALLNFNTERRLLLTGTPLQNNLAELWSLLYFLMPKTIVGGKKVSGFADLDAFQQWFGRPVDKIIETGGGYEQDKETKKTVEKLHQVLRPYLLRRLKKDVEKQMPAKYEHIVYCRLSKRQRFLYDDFMSRAQTKETLASGNFMSIVNCLMQLRKVCNHPDLFEVRPILTSFDGGVSVMNEYANMRKISYTLPKLISENEESIDLKNLNLIFSENDNILTDHHAKTVSNLQCVNQFLEEIKALREKEYMKQYDETQNSSLYLQNARKFYDNYSQQKTQDVIESINFQKYINNLRCSKKAVYSRNLIDLLRIKKPVVGIDALEEPLIKPLQTRFHSEKQIIDNFAVLTPKAVALDVRPLTLGISDVSSINGNLKQEMRIGLYNMNNPFHHLQTKLTIAFPDKSLLQYDCGKLQKLAVLLQQLKDNGHRALIFTQMTKVLDVLEQFLNYHGYLYMRLDGATKIEDRQILTERFNTDSRVTVFILSSRSGGLGINLTGADTVIFYDSDWNPAMDKQCQDRCHRIGQTRDVHIYRFVSEHTIESNILKKANQKRELDNVVIQKGDFTTDYFSKLSVRDLFGSEATNSISTVDDKPLLMEDSEASKNPKSLEKLLAHAEDEDDVKAANLAMKEVDIDNEDFSETAGSQQDGTEEQDNDEYEGTTHVEEYMIKFIANGYYS